MKIGPKEIGTGVYVIAEAGVNHNGDITLAKKLIDTAKKSGADAIKFQTFTVDELVTEHAKQAAYQSQNTGISESQASMLQRLALSHEQFRELKSYAEEVGIEFLSTPFSVKDADFLESIGIAAFKVSSGDLTNLPFLAHLAKKGRPVIISTGMATLSEVEEAFTTLKEGGAHDIIILQCTSEYPAPLEDCNLGVLETFSKRFRVPVGFSDHTVGTAAAVFAVSLGATLVEKHFTLDKNLPGPDHRASLEGDELSHMIAQIRATKIGSITIPAAVLGSGIKEPLPQEKKTAALVRKGIAARADIQKGETLTEKNILIARPEGEIAPKNWQALLGKRATKDIPQGTSLSWDQVV